MGRCCRPQQSLTYAEAGPRANQLAWHLIVDDIGPEDRVALCFERSPEMIIATLAVLKTGAAYVPLDPGHPAERTAWVLADAQPRRLLTTVSLAERLPAGRSIPTVCVDSPSAIDELAALPIARPGNADRTRPLRGAHPAYVIYTSGSTGTPKGVVVSHQSIARYITTSVEILGANAARMPLFTSPVFDLTLTTLFAPLCAGGAIEIVPPGHPAEAVDAVVGPAAMATAVKLTPSHLALIGAQPVTSSPVAVAIVGGEALTAAHVAALKARAPAVRIVNEHGPTETTVGRRR